MVGALDRLDHDPSGAITPAALDLGAGHGGDACWRASRGWEVTAVDVSPTALRRVEQQAVRRGLTDRVITEVHDLTRTMPAGSFSLVTASYLHLGAGRPAVLRQAWSQLAPDGMLLIIDHASAPTWSWADSDTRFPTPRQTLDELDLDTQLTPKRGLRVSGWKLWPATRSAPVELPRPCSTTSSPHAPQPLPHPGRP